MKATMCKMKRTLDVVNGKLTLKRKRLVNSETQQ